MENQSEVVFGIVMRKSTPHGHLQAVTDLDNQRRTAQPRPAGVLMSTAAQFEGALADRFREGGISGDGGD